MPVHANAALTGLVSLPPEVISLRPRRRPIPAIPALVAPELSGVTLPVFHHWMGIVRFGFASRRRFHGELGQWLGSLDNSSFDEPIDASAAPGVAQKCWREFVKQHGTKALRREYKDDRMFAAAQQDERALTAYLDYWMARVQRLQKRSPKWRVAGIADEALREEMLVQLLAAVRKPELMYSQARVGTEASYRYLERVRNERRDRRKIAVVVDGPTVFASHFENARSPEDQFEDAEDAKNRLVRLTRLHAAAGKAGQSWIRAFYEDIDEYGKLEPARAARRLNRSRSNATRALGALKGHLRRITAIDCDEP